MTPLALQSHTRVHTERLDGIVSVRPRWQEGHSPPCMPPGRPAPACSVCATQESGKYKCPVCLSPYCSVPCYQRHKAGTACVPPQPPPRPTGASTPGLSRDGGARTVARQARSRPGEGGGGVQ